LHIAVARRKEKLMLFLRTTNMTFLDHIVTSYCSLRASHEF